MIDILLITLSFVALLSIVLEEWIHINKAQSTLFIGTLAWLILFVDSSSTEQTLEITNKLLHNITEISVLWLFLVSAMTFVTYLNRKGMIERLLNTLMPEQISIKKLMVFTAIFAFVFSAIVDNITATLVCVAMVLSLSVTTQQTLRLIVIVIFAVNSGGVALITGDVTTLMIFTQGKLSVVELLWLFLPSALGVLLLSLSLMIGQKGIVKLKQNTMQLQPLDYAIAGIFVFTIIATISANIIFRVPPVLTFLFGLSVMFLLAHAFGDKASNDPIMDYIRYIEFETLLFFLGVLLMVGALEHIDALEVFVAVYKELPPVYANFVMGILSAAVDNVPLTAALLKANIAMTATEWMLFTYAVGVGGSLLVIGSAAGIVAMSKCKTLTFSSYGRFSLILFGVYLLTYCAVIFVATYVEGSQVMALFEAVN